MPSRKTLSVAGSARPATIRKVSVELWFGKGGDRWDIGEASQIRRSASGLGICWTLANRPPRLPLLAGSCFGVGYDADYFELLGRALLGCGHMENAGRFFFLCGVRRVEYAAAIALFLARRSDPHNFRQLQSRLPERVRVLWRLTQFPPAIAEELRTLGWPEDTQEAIVMRKKARRTIRST